MLTIGNSSETTVVVASESLYVFSVFSRGFFPSFFILSSSSNPGNPPLSAKSNWQLQAQEQEPKHLPRRAWNRCSSADGCHKISGLYSAK